MYVTSLQGLLNGRVIIEPSSLLASPEYWERLSKGLHASCSPEAFNSHIFTQDIAENTDLAHNLSRDGYFATPCIASQFTEEISGKLAKLSATIRALQAAGWPPVFIFVYDEVWSVIDSIFDVMQPILGDDCVLEPSVFCWALLRNIDARASTALTEDTPSNAPPIGNSFSLPHRDYPHTECFDSNGNPCLLNIWVPFTPTTVDNGCIYVLPKEFDDLFDKPSHELHMKSAIPNRSNPPEMTTHFNLGTYMVITHSCSHSTLYMSQAVHDR